MNKKLLNIILLIVFIASILQPAMPFVQYFLIKNNIVKENCCCGEKNLETEFDKMANNGDNYLKALIKRTCKNNKNKKKAIPVLQIVYVKKLIYEHISTYECPNKIFYRISTFIIQPKIDNYIIEIFHPPTYA